MSDYENMTVAELKELLKEAGLPVSGKKADLIARLQEEADAPVVEESMMKYDHDKFVTRWSRNTTDDSKMKEAEEIYRARNSLLSVLM